MKITALGHSAFRIETGKAVILIDPFITGNPAAKPGMMDLTRDCTHVLLTHGHDDHVGDTVSICKATGATLVSNFEVCNYLAAHRRCEIQPRQSWRAHLLRRFRCDLHQCLAFLVEDHQGRHSDLSRQSGGLRDRAQDRDGQDRLCHGRYRHFARHEPGPGTLQAGRSASCRSATASPWGPIRRRSPVANFSPSARSFLATMPRLKAMSSRTKRHSWRRWGRTPRR